MFSYTKIMQAMVAAGVVTPSDPYFNLVTLLLPGNGTNGAQNNTFLDSSSNNFTITRNGNTTQGTFSPFSQTGWSNYFNGSSDYLTAANNTALQLGSSDFTIEGWVYVSASSASLQTFLAKGTGAGNQASYAIQLNTSNQWVYYLSGNGSTWSIASGVVMGTVSLNAWNHVALVRSGSTFTPYVNGVAGTTTTSATALFAGTSVLSIGADDSGSTKLAGYVSNARVVKGTAVYTSNFTPSTTPLTAITNTQLLTCQSNRFIDNSSNAFAITVNGTPSVQAFSPFAPTAAYSAATNGGSGYFDGSGDYLSVASNAAFDIMAGSYTIEFWFYPTSTATAILVDRQDPNNPYYGYSVRLLNVNTQSADLNWNPGFTGGVTTSGGPIKLNQWNHIAFTCDGTTLRIYANGVLQASSTTLATNNYAGALTIGGRAGAQYGFGYISGFILRKGTASYTGSTYTIPTAPPTAITNTQLLLNFTNGGIIDATGKNVLETVGDAQISTTQSKWGGSSLYFDGTGDWLVVPSNQMLNLPKDFTVEFWVYLNSTADATFFAKWGASPTYAWAVQLNSTNLRFYTGNNGTLGTGYTFTWGPSTGQWYHVAITRSGTNLRAFINGTQIGTTQTSVTDNCTSSANLGIGVNLDGNIQAFNGYIDDLRITNGYARYTANFTVPSSAFPLQ